jgi:hypothetical protein
MPNREDDSIRLYPLYGRGPREAYKLISKLRVSYDICECCGCEYGLDDNERCYLECVEDGMKRFDDAYRRVGWSIDFQLSFKYSHGDLTRITNDKIDIDSRYFGCVFSFAGQSNGRRSSV